MKIALGIEYDGSKYSGWQRQQHVSSVQQKIEEALSRIADETITVFCAGRTDAGVHATGQVIHFETEANRPINAWAMGTNTHLPSNIAIKWAQTVDESFHARFSAQARRYRYIIYNHHYRHAILNQGITHYYIPLNEVKMHQAAQYLLGENDFSAFRAAQCQSLSPWRNIHHISVTRFDRYLVIDIQANAFVHHMVRNIVGSLIEVGNGHQTEAWIRDLLLSQDRTQAAATAKPDGLYLVDVIYPAQFELPRTPLGPIFLN
ncbi:tRNA pseudouridine(38-40) synthase [Orbus hercynius]|uniref:tRNA pseudouridine synthase A n=1 Tax=Orbus hercynius TaxID=593135 RepID=A0A495RCJ7_9GAMM|nr:tRNA pseudouridine(38-40) synthase TruA [Orbus hercynius]RKS84738.1 tRNA pseudouridine(38-40) synthase [Orbus hercynius]